MYLKTTLHQKCFKLSVKLLLPLSVSGLFKYMFIIDLIRRKNQFPIHLHLTNAHHVAVRLSCDRSQMTSNFGKKIIDADSTSCAALLWSINKQTHSNIGLIYLIYIIKMQSNVNGDVIFASLLHLPSAGPVVGRNQNACIVTIRRDRHLSRSFRKFDCCPQSLRTVFFPGTLSRSSTWPCKHQLFQL